MQKGDLSSLKDKETVERISDTAIGGVGLLGWRLRSSAETHHCQLLAVCTTSRAAPLHLPNLEAASHALLWNYC